MNRRNFLRIAAGVLAGARAPLYAAPPAGIGVGGRVAEPVLGMGVHVLDDRSIARTLDLGIRHIRHTVYWHLWSDRAYRAAFAASLERAADLDLLLVLHGGGGSDQEFIDFVVQVARMAPKASLQLWNEPDGGFPGSERFERSPARYAEHLRRAYGQVKDTSPDSTIVTAGFAMLEETLRRWVEASAPYSDIVAVHVYGMPMLPAYIDKFSVARSVTDKPIWCTELGMERAVMAPGWTYDWEIVQRDTIRECVESSVPYARTYIHVLEDGIPDGHGMFRVDGTARPVVEWLKRRSG